MQIRTNFMLLTISCQILQLETVTSIVGARNRQNIKYSEENIILLALGNMTNYEDL